MIESMSEEIKRHEKALESACYHDKLKALKKEIQDGFGFPEELTEYIVKIADREKHAYSFYEVEQEAYRNAEFVESAFGCLKLARCDVRDGNIVLREDNGASK